MIENILQQKYKILFVTIIFTATGCSLNVSNPNEPTSEVVLNSDQGIKSLAIGMQGFFASTVYPNIVIDAGITANEIAVNTTYINLVNLARGGDDVKPKNSSIRDLWKALMRLNSMADKLLKNAPDVVKNEADLSGIMALASVYKAMALGYTLQFFKQAPIESGSQAKFYSRDKVFSKILDLLGNALKKINSTSPSNDFKQDVLLSGFNLKNTIYALQARYNLFAGNYTDAVSYANKVDMSVKSVLTYDGSTLRNTIYDEFNISNDYAPIDDFGLPALVNPNDQRLKFYLLSSQGTSNPFEFEVDELDGFWNSASSEIPVYFPGGITLIKAESYLRLNQIDNAIKAINKVRTKKSQEDPFGIGASLEPYSGPKTKSALLKEIYYQRSAEMFMSGMRFTDARRLEMITPSNNPPLDSVTRMYYPYPKAEHENNPNTPTNPKY